MNTKLKVKRKFKTKTKIILGIIIAIIIFIFMPSGHYLARLTTYEIREQILLLIPIGTYLGDVHYFIDTNENWSIANKASPYRVRVNMGGYRYFVFWTDVIAIWIFDENFKVYDIIVRKDTDMP